MMCVGQLSFFLSALSWSMKDVRWIRSLAIASGTMGVSYNSYLAAHADPATANELWKIVGWLSLFLCINIFQTLRLIRDNIEIRLSTSERALLVGAFPSMRSRDLRRLMESAEKRTLKQGDKVVDTGEQMVEVLCLINGTLIEHPQDAAPRLLRPHSLIGEASWLIREQMKGSPSSIIAGEVAQVLAWPYETLDKLAESLPSLKAALTDGAARGMILKRDFLHNDQAAGIEPMLTPSERRLHAGAFPMITSSDLSNLLERSATEKLPANTPLDMAGSVAVIECGRVLARRLDGHEFVLEVGSMIGEMGWAAPDRPRPEHVTLTVIADATLKVWTDDVLRDLALRRPGLFAGFMRAVARDMAIKLSLPMQQESVPRQVKLQAS